MAYVDRLREIPSTDTGILWIWRCVALTNVLTYHNTPSQRIFFLIVTHPRTTLSTRFPLIPWSYRYMPIQHSLNTISTQYQHSYLILWHIYDTSTCWSSFIKIPPSPSPTTLPPPPPPLLTHHHHHHHQPYHHHLHHHQPYHNHLHHHQPYHLHHHCQGWSSSAVWTTWRRRQSGPCTSQKHTGTWKHMLYLCCMCYLMCMRMCCMWCICVCMCIYVCMYVMYVCAIRIFVCMYVCMQT